MPTKMRAAKRGKTTVAGMRKRKYKKLSCHATKTAAKSAAASVRQKGNTAQVRKVAGKGYCVYSAGKMKRK